MSTNRRGAEDAETRELGEEITRLSGEVIGAAIEVHRVLGPGFLESVYEEALCVELNLRRISFKRQPLVAVNYKGQQVGEGRLDLLVDNTLIVELKAIESLAPIHYCPSPFLPQNDTSPPRPPYQLQRPHAQKRHPSHYSLLLTLSAPSASLRFVISNSLKIIQSRCCGFSIKSLAKI